MHSAWLEARRGGLGGSDVAALLGVSKWSSALTLWADKTGKDAGVDLEEVEHVQWGARLEQAIAEGYWEKTGRTPNDLLFSGPFTTHILDHMGETKRMLQSEDYPWALATPDDFIREYLPFPWEDHADEKFRGPGILEVKNTNSFMRSDWDDGPPPYYEVQAQHYLLVTGLEWCSFAVLIGGNEMKCFDMPRKDMLIEQIIELGSYFWENNVLKDVPPKASGITRETGMLKGLYPQESDRVVTLDADMMVQVGLIRRSNEMEKRLKAKLKEVKTYKEAARNNVRMFMGDANRAVGTDVEFTCRTVRRKGHVVQPSQSRQLRMKNVGPR